MTNIKNVSYDRPCFILVLCVNTAQARKIFNAFLDDLYSNEPWSVGKVENFSYCVYVNDEDVSYLFVSNDNYIDEIVKRMNANIWAMSVAEFMLISDLERSLKV